MGGVIVRWGLMGLMVISALVLGGQAQAEDWKMEQGGIEPGKTLRVISHNLWWPQCPTDIVRIRSPRFICPLACETRSLTLQYHAYNHTA